MGEQENPGSQNVSDTPEGDGESEVPPPTPKLRIGLQCTDEEELATFVRSLGWFGEVRLILDPDDLAGPLEVDLLVAEVGGVDLLELDRLKTCRAANPDAPLLMLGRGVSANLAVELVRLLGDDILCLPSPDPDTLFRKVERLLIGSWQPVLEAAYLQALKPVKVPSGHERRRVIRADVPEVWRTWAVVENLSGRPCVRVGDLSAPQADAPGGLMLLADKRIAKALVKELHGFGRGAKISLSLALYGDDSAIPLTATVARIPNPREGGVYPLGVTVQFDVEKDLTRFARFWTACRLQSRREEGAIKSAA